jgi:hypothetical protein
MSCVVKENVAFNRGDVGFLGVKPVGLEPDGIAHVIMKFLRTMFHYRGGMLDERHRGLLPAPTAPVA